MTTLEILKSINKNFFEENNSLEIEVIIQNGFVSKDTIESRWLGYPGATEEEIRKKEQILNASLPPSYKEFLIASNGFKLISPFLDNLLPIEKVNWANQTEGEFWTRYKDYNSNVSDEQYFDYSDNQDPVLCRDEYLYHSLKISEWCQGLCVFLNPLVIHNNEWEVLEYATWYPGTMRYQSFKDYLLNLRKISWKD